SDVGSTATAHTNHCLQLAGLMEPLQNVGPASAHYIYRIAAVGARLEFSKGVVCRGSHLVGFVIDREIAGTGIGTRIDGNHRLSIGQHTGAEERKVRPFGIKAT